MKNIIKTLSQWGNNLSINISEDIERVAILQNEWFTQSEIKLAISAICTEMLCEERLSEWFAQYDTDQQAQENVLIIMAGNIPLVGFFDLLCTIAAGHCALVKPSHKDTVLMKWVIDELHKIDPNIPIYIYDNTQPVDRVIATGGDSARRHFAATYPGTPTLLRGTRHSLAIITDNDKSLEGLTEDIFSYSGLGCRNVSMLFVPSDFDLTKLPKCEVNPKHRNNYLRVKALFTINNAPFSDTGTHCLIESQQFPNEISQISIVRYNNLSEVEQWVATHDDEIQCIVADDSTINHPRQVAFGEAQHPTLFDYADGVDTMKFLLNR